MNKTRKIPSQYLMAANILKKMNDKKGSLNSLIAKLNKKNNIKLIYAIVMKTIQNLNEIKQMIEIMTEDNGLDLQTNQFLTQVLIADLIFGKRLEGIRDLPQIKDLIAFEDKFNKITKKPKTEESVNKFIVRYIRINLIKTELKKIIKKLVNNGFQKIDYNKNDITFEEFKELVIGLKEDQFIIDYHFEDDLLAFNINATKRLQKMKAFKNRNIVMQDKASLIPVECLGLFPGIKLMDVCCAPGMKTTAIASRLKNNGRIFAFDKDQDRIKQMKSNIEENGVTCARIRCQDFTSVNPSDFRSIDAILLDPSCSGSGMNKRVDYVTDMDKLRLFKLGSFQTRMLCHAISFGAKRIVYSTCSLSLIENEKVVDSALKGAKLGQSYEVVDALPDWPIRGIGDFPFASKCIRSNAKKSLTNGFFVCVLQRIDTNNDLEPIEDKDDSIIKEELNA